MSFEALGASNGVLLADADLSALQFQFVRGGGTTNGVARALTTLGTQRVLGVLYNKPALGQVCRIVTSGIVRVKIGGTVAVGDKITASATGAAVATTTTGHQVHGEALEAGTVGQIIAIQLFPNSGIV